MKITFEKDPLLEALSKAAKVRPRKSTLPIIEMVKFSIQENECSIMSTDLETTYIHTLNCQSNNEGEFVVSPDELIDTLAKLPDVTLEFEVMETIVKLNTFGGLFKVSKTDPKDYPEIPSLEGSKTMEFDLADIRGGIATSIPYAANDELRPVMNGIYVHFNEHNMLCMVGTDAHALMKYVLHEIEGNDFEFILPAKACHIVKGLKGKDTKVEISVGKNHTSFKTEGQYIVARHVEGKFPAYQSVIPKESDKTYTIKRKELIQAISLLKSYCSVGSLVTLTFKDSQVILLAKDNDLGKEGKYTISCDTDVEEEFTIGFNIHNIDKIVNTASADDMDIEMSDPTKPTLWYNGVKDESIMQMLLMPMMI